MKGFGNLMRQAQQMQKKMGAVQEELNERNVEGESGQGKVKVTVSCGYEMKGISIDKELIDPEDSETLEDLIIVATNDAFKKAKEVKEEEMTRVTGGLAGKLPGIF